MTDTVTISRECAEIASELLGMRGLHNLQAEIEAALSSPPSQGLREALTEARKQLFLLCEETEEKYREIGQRDLEGKEGAFARGRCFEAKSIRNAMGEVFRALLASPPGAAR